MMPPAVRRLAGFVALSCGIGLRLDTTWQVTALLLIVGGAGAVVQALVAEASVSPPRER
jgi:hypothetical protein